ncbi:MAG: hypothetical protein OET16_06820, partial [Chromatiales bacterium]|nr:hypothetical protein [Chromatiales bacterium]
KSDYLKLSPDPLSRAAAIKIAGSVIWGRRFQLQAGGTATRHPEQRIRFDPCIRSGSLLLNSNNQSRCPKLP